MKNLKDVKEDRFFRASLSRMPLKTCLALVFVYFFAFQAQADVFPNITKTGELTEILQQQSKSITGKIVDSSGEPIIGANIIEKGTSNGTVTDFDGNFTLTISNNAVLLISYIGYLEQEVTTNNKSTISVILQEDRKTLDELVVVGYGIQKKVNLSGSVSTINVDQIKDRAQSNVLAAIQGASPGVTVINRPGQTPSINFRGRGNLGASEPLYVIDGAISDASFFSNLDPNSIESVSFLKDAASSSIYGARAAYGVVLVTTKGGKSGKLQVSYSGLVGSKMLTYKPDLVNSWEYAELFNEAKYNTNPNGGKNQGYTEEEIGWFKDGSKPDLYPNTNWIDLIYDDYALTTQHSLNLSGGSDNIRYFAGMGYLYDKDNMPGRKNERYNLTLNVESDVTSWMTFNGRVKYIQNDRNIDGGTPSLNNVLIVPSTFVAKQSNGEWGSVDAGHVASGTFAGGNPLRAFSFKNWNRGQTENTMYELGANIKPIEGLIIRGQGVYKRMERKQKNYNATREDVPSFLVPGAIIGGTGNKINSMSMDWGSDSWLNFTETANYNWSNEVHSFGGLLGVSYEHYRFESLGASRENFPADSFTDMSAGSTSGANYKNSSGSSENKMLSYFSRINYSLMDRYLFEANFRADASSRFYKTSRWGYFPSFSTAWRISEENFMSNTSEWLDNLKVRLSYGTLGNINNVGYYDYFQNYGANVDYSFSDVPVKGIVESKPANPNLSWEKVSLGNIGLDFDFFGGKLSGTADYYIKNTSDILLGYNVPSETGISKAPSQNIAEVRNKGFELSLSHRNTIGSVSYTIGGNIALNQNEILNLATSDDIIQNMAHGVGKYILKEGESVGSFYGFKTDGLYSQADIDAGHYYIYGSTTPNAGDIKFLPQRENVKFKEAITSDDRTIIGNDVPNITYALNLSVGYKGFEFSVFGQGVSGVDVAFEVYQLHPFFHGQDNPRRFHMNRWNESNPDSYAIYPRIYDASSPHTAYNRTFSDYSLFDASYFRFKTVTLGYKIPKSLVTRLSLSDLKLFVTGDNLLTIRGDKKVKDFDPETAGSVVQTLGSKAIAFGINVSF